MRNINIIIMILLFSIITLIALKYSIKYISISTEYMLYKQVGGGTEYLINDYKITPLSECIVTIDIIDKYYHTYDDTSNTDIRVCYRLTNMSIDWNSNYDNGKSSDSLQSTFEYEKGSISGLKFK